MSPQIKTQQLIWTGETGKHTAHVGLTAQLHVLAAFHIVCCTALLILLLQHRKPLAVESDIVHATWHTYGITNT